MVAMFIVLFYLLLLLLLLLLGLFVPMFVTYLFFVPTRGFFCWVFLFTCCVYLSVSYFENIENILFITSQVYFTVFGLYNGICYIITNI